MIQNNYMVYTRYDEILRTRNSFATGNPSILGGGSKVNTCILAASSASSTRARARGWLWWWWWFWWRRDTFPSTRPCAMRCGCFAGCRISNRRAWLWRWRRWWWWRGWRWCWPWVWATNDASCCASLSRWVRDFSCRLQPAGFVAVEGPPSIPLCLSSIAAVLRGRLRSRK